MRAVMPGSHRLHIYMSDEEARRQAEVIAFCDEITEQYSLRALIGSVVTFIAAVAAALVTSFG